MNSDATTIAPIAAGLHRAALATAALVAATGAVVLAGWWLDIAALKSLLPHWATMKANAALGFLLAGLALWGLHGEAAATRRRRAARAAAGAVALLGLLTLAEYLLGLDFGIDNVLFPLPAEAVPSPHPGRMAPATAVGFLCSGLGLLLLDTSTRRGLRPAQWLALVPLAIGYIANSGYLYGAESLYRVGPFASVSLHTSLSFALLGAGMLCARPQQGWMALFGSRLAGGVVVRRVVPVVLAVIPLLFWVRLQGERAGYYGTEFGIVLMMLTNIFVLCVLVFWSAFFLDGKEAEMRRSAALLGASEARYRALVEQSLAGIYIIQDGRVRYANQAMADIFGYDSPRQMMEQFSIMDGVSPEDRERVLEAIRRREAGEIDHVHYTARFLRRDGRSADLEVYGRGHSHEGRPAIIGLLLDVTARLAAKTALQRQTEELSLRNEQLSRFNRVAVGREQSMIELKRQINALSLELGRAPPYAAWAVPATGESPGKEARA